MKVCDPHFHLWNINQRPNPNLGPGVNKNLPVYQAIDYAGDMSRLPTPLELTSGLHVETVVGQMSAGFPLDTVEETRWICNQLGPDEASFPFGVVGYVHLARDSAESEQMLAKHQEAAKGRFRGVRMILNHHADNPDLTWPQVEHGDFLHSGIFQEGIALLGEKGLSFDLQCNPHQLEDSATVFSRYPQTRVILNHLGLMHDGEDEAHEHIWQAGMRALADVSHVYVKLSMLWFSRNNYHQNAVEEAKIRDMVREVINLFGYDRCMFASNYPVEKVQGISIETLYGKFLDWTADMSDSQRSALFYDTAVQAYNID